MILVALAIVALAVLFAWVFGGLLLRLSGLALVLSGAGVLALSGNANGILVFAIGALLWLAGHWHYGLRHNEYKSPLARYFFCRWAAEQLDPSRRRAVTGALDQEAGAALRDSGGHRRFGPVSRLESAIEPTREGTADR